VLISGPLRAAAGKNAVTRLKVPVLAPPDTSITAENIQATISGVKAKVVAVATPREDIVLMLVLDLSDNLTLAQSAKSALLEQLGRLPPKVHVALMRAQDGLRVIKDPGADLSDIKSAVESLSVSGRAGLLDSIEIAAGIGDSILTKSAVRLAILYVTDSDVTNYREDFTNPVINKSDQGDLSRKFPEALIQEKISRIDANLARSQAPIFIVQVNYQNDRLNQAYMNGLRQSADMTGGMTVVCRSNAEIPPAIADVWSTIINHQSVTLEMPKVEARTVSVKLDISGPDGGLQGLAYRSRFDFRKE
jgi:hypothetical protein